MRLEQLFAVFQDQTIGNITFYGLENLPIAFWLCLYPATSLKLRMPNQASMSQFPRPRFHKCQGWIVDLLLFASCYLMQVAAQQLDSTSRQNEEMRDSQVRWGRIRMTARGVSIDGNNPRQRCQAGVGQQRVVKPGRLKWSMTILHTVNTFETWPKSSKSLGKPTRKIMTNICVL